MSRRLSCGLPRTSQDRRGDDSFRGARREAIRVGVVVVEGVKAGQKLNGWIMDQDKRHRGARRKVRHSHRAQARHHGAAARTTTVIKYGVDIGTGDRADRSGRARSRAQHQDEALVRRMDLKNATFRGYKRENGRVGVRNHVIILPVDDLSNAAAEAVANNIKGTHRDAAPLRARCSSAPTSTCTSAR